MKYVSTRAIKSQASGISFSEALSLGLAPDGGLYVPEAFPHFNPADFDASLSMAQFGAQILTPFLEGDVLKEELPAICGSAFNFPIPLRFLRDKKAVLELFHGPTAAFKDVGARFLAECVSRLPAPSGKPRKVLVATSGDTGGAVAGAFFEKPGIEVFVLYPKGKISLRQEKQIAGWGGNVHAIAVRGTFDDCQRVVKQALSDVDARSRRAFISANSISLGRLLPQMIYHAKASLEYHRATGRKPTLVIPTGNLGNAVAALWAKQIGFPIAQVVLATNANTAIGDFFVSGVYKGNPTIATLANAMDVGDPSNIERLRHLYPSMSELKNDVTTVSVSDSEISSAIKNTCAALGETWCPHTATAAVAAEQLGLTECILVATAHAAKFETIVEPLIGRRLDIPPALAALLDKPQHSQEIDPTLSALKQLW